METRQLNAAPPSETISGRQVQAQYVTANVSQESTHNIRIRLVDSKGINIKTMLVCRPRKSNAPSPNTFQFPATIVKNFAEVNKKVMAWLAQSGENVQHYLQDPVGALLKAGVELPRADQKQLARNFEDVRATQLAAPGAEIQTLTVSADPNAKLTLVTSDPSSKKSTGTATGNKDCGCK